MKKMLCVMLLAMAGVTGAHAHGVGGDAQDVIVVSKTGAGQKRVAVIVPGAPTATFYHKGDVVSYTAWTSSTPGTGGREERTFVGVGTLPTGLIASYSATRSANGSALVTVQVESVDLEKMDHFENVDFPHTRSKTVFRKTVSLAPDHAESVTVPLGDHRAETLVFSNRVV